MIIDFGSTPAALEGVITYPEHTFTEDPRYGTIKESVGARGASPAPTTGVEIRLFGTGDDSSQ